MSHFTKLNFKWRYLRFKNACRDGRQEPSLVINPAEPSVPEQGEQSRPTGHSQAQPKAHVMKQVRGDGAVQRTWHRSRWDPVKVIQVKPHPAIPKQVHYGRRSIDLSLREGLYSQHSLWLTWSPAPPWHSSRRGGGSWVELQWTPGQCPQLRGTQLLWVINSVSAHTWPWSLSQWEHSLSFEVKNMWPYLYLACDNTQTCICTMIQIFWIQPGKG